jgi:uncharacterized membrane protein YkoI
MLIGACALLAACSGATTPGGAGTTTPGLPGANPGHINGEMVALATRLPGVQKLRIRTAASGKIEKLALYHLDASQVPPGIRKLAEEKLPGAKVRRYETELYADKGRAYDVEVTSADGKECEVAALASGAFLYSECALKLDELPSVVRAAALKLVPRGELVEAEKKQGPGVDEFTVEVKSAGLIHYLRLGPAGETLWHGLRVPSYVELAYDPGAPMPAADPSPGRIDGEFVSLGARAQGVIKAKIRTSLAGDIIKLALYHKDGAQIPAPVLELAAGSGNKLGNYESELFADRGSVFEVEMITPDNRECEVGARADGTRLYDECGIKKEAVPAKVSAAALKVAPGGEIVEVERKEGDGVVEYSVELTNAAGMHYIKINESGEVIWHGLRINVDLEVTVP